MNLATALGATGAVFLPFVGLAWGFAGYWFWALGKSYRPRVNKQTVILLFGIAIILSLVTMGFWIAGIWTAVGHG